MLGASYVGFGAFVHQSGLTFFQGVASSITGWALPGQIALIEIFAAGGSLLAAAIAVGLANARLMPMVVTLMPILREGEAAPSPRLIHYLSAHFIALTGWAIAMPDVYSLRHTTLEDHVEPVAHEIKVRRADLLADLTAHAARAVLARPALGGLYHAVAAGETTWHRYASLVIAWARANGLPVKVVILNNGYLGMVRQWQELTYESRYSNSYSESLPDFVKLAEAYGHVGLLVEKPGDVEGALKEAIRLKDRTVFLDIRTDPTENVWPMVQAGKGITEMLLGSEDL